MKKIITISHECGSDGRKLGCKLSKLLNIAYYDNAMIKGLVKKYNKLYKEQLPKITVHTFRHDSCTRMANVGMNPKALQYLMGHASITMTLGYYAHASFESAKAEMERIEAEKAAPAPMAV